MKKLIIQEISNEELIDLFEECVCAWHYDPVGVLKDFLNYDIDQLKDEILSRLKEPNGAEPNKD